MTFRENRRNIFIYAKNTHFFCFRAKIIFFCKNINIFQMASRIAPVLHIFPKTFRKINIFAQIFVFSQKTAKMSSHKIFP